MSTTKQKPSKNSKKNLKKTSKLKSSAPGGSRKLSVKLIHPKYDITLGRCKYSIENYKIIYPPVDSEQAVPLMKRHICAL